MQLKNLQLQVASQIREVDGRCRPASSGQIRAASRELQENSRRGKQAAGMSTSFFVFQTQRDLAQARTQKFRRSDYNDHCRFRRRQEVPLAPFR